MMTDCKYPDWEGNVITEKHVIGKDGYCAVCGEKIMTDWLSEIEERLKRIKGGENLYDQLDLYIGREFYEPFSDNRRMARVLRSRIRYLLKLILGHHLQAD